MGIDHPRAIVERVAESLLRRDERLGVAESCTGGMIAEWLTDLPGSSRWFECGWVTYSNAAKEALLDVPGETLARDGAVSGPTVLAMTAGVLRHARTQWAVAVSGIAGPSGGTVDKPVGTVWIAWRGAKTVASASRFQFPGSRAEVRTQTAAAALAGLLDLISSPA
ncbi:MAG TPA: CinA family protein [Nevskiaceae bacterium]